MTCFLSNLLAVRLNSSSNDLINVKRNVYGTIMNTVKHIIARWQKIQLEIFKTRKSFVNLMVQYFLGYKSVYKRWSTYLKQKCSNKDENFDFDMELFIQVCSWFEIWNMIRVTFNFDLNFSGWALLLSGFHSCFPRARNLSSYLFALQTLPTISEKYLMDSIACCYHNECKK